MLKGVLEGCILEVIRQEETYAYEISEKLKSFGFGDISEGTIYPIILRLNTQGFLESKMRKSPIGPKRKYYRLTQAGEEKLIQFKKDWTAITHAIDRLFEGGINNG